MNTIYELYKLGKLANKRHPMYESSKYAKLFIYITATFWVGYLVFFGILFAFAFQGEAVEPYHLLNSGLAFVFFIDYILRFTFQKPPTQEMQPFVLLPIKRIRFIDALLVRSGLSPFNLLWLCMFLPFALLTVTRFYGLWGVFTYCAGIWLLSLLNNYWYLLTRTLMAERIVWLLLPVAVYGATAAALFIPEESPLYDFFLNVGEGFITFDLLTICCTLAALALIIGLNRMLLSRVSYQEMAKTEDSKVKHINEFNFLNRFGEIGEYMQLELKLFLRNKTPRTQLITVLAVVVMFVLLVSGTDVYGEKMNTFIFFYNFAIFGISFLASVMSYEGNYIDGLMTRKEAIYHLLLAKFYLYTILMLMPLVLMIPTMIAGKASFMTCLAWMLFVAGPIYCILFQVAVFNKQTIPLHKKLTMRMNNDPIRNVITFVVFAVPLALRYSLDYLWDEEITNLTFIIIGVVFIATHRFWMKNIYHRFMARKYVNLEGFINSREE